MIDEVTNPGSYEYGPQTAEIVAALAKLADPSNDEVFRAISFAPVPERVVRGWIVAADVARKAAEVAGRGEVRARAFDEARFAIKAYLTESGDLPWDPAYAVEALVVKDLVGGEFTEEMYEVLTYDLVGFLLLVDESTPYSLEQRDICALLSSMEISASDALTVVRATEPYSDQRLVLVDLLTNGGRVSNGTTVADALLALDGAMAK